MAETETETETEPARPVRAQRFERQMTDAEALMWNVEKDPWLNPSGGAISIHDRMPDMDHFRAQLAYTVATVPRLMEHVVSGVGRLSPPVWRPDPEFDLDHHVRVTALPAPGTMRQLLDAVAQIYQDPYDRTRPLWMMYVIGGLEGGRAASIFKIHHAVADGTGAARLSELYIQPTRDPPDPPDVDLAATLAAAVEADASEHGGTSFVENVLGTGAHFARRQAGIARRVAGEVAMWGADPLRPATSSPTPCAPWGSCGHRSPAVAAARRRPPTATARCCRAGHRCGATAPATATWRCCRSRSRPRWPRPRASADRSTTG